MPRGWKGNALGLQRWEVEAAHQARLDATEAIAVLMRDGMTFWDAKKEILGRARRTYKYGRPELIAGCLACISDVQFGDMPPSIRRGIKDDFLAGIEEARGYKAGPIELAFYRLTGFAFSAEPKKARSSRKR